MASMVPIPNWTRFGGRLPEDYENSVAIVQMDMLSGGFLTKISET